MGKVTKISPQTDNKSKQKKLLADRLATILLVQTKLLPPSVLGIKDLKDKI